MSAPGISSLLPGFAGHDDDLDRLGASQQRQRVRNRPGGVAAAVPTDHRTVQLQPRPLNVRYDQHRPAGSEQCRLDDQALRPGRIRLGLGDDHEIEPPGDAAEQLAGIGQAGFQQTGFRGQPVSARRLLECGDRGLGGFLDLRRAAPNDAGDGAVEHRPWHDRLIDERDGRQVRLERGGHRHRKIRRDVVLGAHRQVDDDIFDHMYPVLCLALSSLGVCRSSGIARSLRKS